MKHLSTLRAFVLGALFLAPVAAFAQNSDDLRSSTQLAIDIDRSEQLYREASDMAAANEDLVETAERFVESARHRPYGDVKAYVALNRAGQLFSHAGRTRAAHRTFARAGMRAMETGQIFEAAMAYANAAELSTQDRGAGRQVLDFVRIAHRLSEAPGLSDEQRQRIRQRLAIEGS